MHKLLLPIALLLLLTACSKPLVEAPIEPAPMAAVSVDDIVPVSSRDLIPVGNVSGATQAYLAKRMRDHGRNATDLLYAMVLLDHDGTERIAKRIVAGPSRDPYYEQDEARLHEEFPAAFFDLETSMRASAQLMGALLLADKVRMSSITTQRLLVSVWIAIPSLPSVVRTMDPSRSRRQLVFASPV